MLRKCSKHKESMSKYAKNLRIWVQSRELFSSENMSWESWKDWENELKAGKVCLKLRKWA